MTKKKKAPKFDRGTEVRAIARERVGRVKATKVIKTKKEKYTLCGRHLYEEL